MNEIINTDMEKATVARGRTVRFGGKNYGPGEEIELPAADVAKLRRSGFLHDQDARVVEIDCGRTDIYGDRRTPGFSRS